MPPERFSLALLVSGRCNLSCGYCYQDARRCREELPWPSAKAALDLLLASGTERTSLELTGGEPLLAWDLVVQCIERVRSGPSPPRDSPIVLATNGLLLTEERIAYLESRDVAVRLSFDGVREAQELRAPGTFAALDTLLDGLGRKHPGYLASHVSVGVTVVAQAVPLFARSLAYLMSKGVRAIRVYPKMTFDADWNERTDEELDRQIIEVLDVSEAHWRSTGEVPVEFLRPRTTPSPSTGDGFLCGAPRGHGFCVDPDGHAWACPLLAGSLQHLPHRALAASRLLNLGPVEAPSFARHLAELPQRAREEPLFTDAARRRASPGPCRHCPWKEECFVCPATLRLAPGAGDADRVPDALCAFNRATLKARALWALRREVAGGPLLADALGKLAGLIAHPPGAGAPGRGE